MRGFAAVFRMEMAEKRNVFIAAAVTGVLPFIPGMLHPARWTAGGDLRNVAAYTLMIIFLEVMAVMLGITMIGTELANGRLAFYFSRPVGPIALWLGKFVAALALLFLSGTIILGPTALTGTFDWPLLFSFNVRYLLSLTLITLLGSHALSIMRSRSSWLPLDLLGGAVFSLLLWYALRSLMMAGDQSLGTTEQILVGLAFVAIFGSAAAQLIRGRTDRAASHATFSITLWSTLFLVACGCDGYSWWFTHPEISDLQSIGMASAPTGGWIGISGNARHRASFLRSAFLLRPDSGRTFSVGLSIRPPLTSRSGVIVGFRSDGSVWFFDTRKEGSSPRDLPLRTDQQFPGRDAPDHAIAGILSDDGTRLALLDGTNISVYSLPEAKLLAATNAAGRPRLFFKPNGVLEIIEIRDDGKRTTITVQNLDTATKHLETSSIHLDGVVTTNLLFTDGSGERLVLLTPGSPRSAELIDIQSGRILFQARSKVPSFIDGTRFPVVEGTDDKTVFRLVDRDGRVSSSFSMPLKPQESAWTTRSTPKGSLLFRVFDYSTRPNPTFSVAIVNPTTGQVLRRIENVVPAINSYWTLDPRALPPSSSEYFIDSTNGSLLQIDPDTGTRRVLIKGSGLKIPFD